MKKETAQEPASQDSHKKELSPELEKENERAVWAHLLPFLVWLLLMALLGDADGWEYAWRTIIGSALLLVMRPWRWYPALKLKNIPLAVLVGIGVFFIWIGMETSWVKETTPWLAEFYEKYFVQIWPIGEMREAISLPHAYDPSETGWPLFWVHMFGTSVSIAIIEEFFWRGFFYRWMLGSPFFKIDLGKLNMGMFVLIACFFGIEHNEWLAGILCGLIYGYLIIRTRDIWAAVIAHGITNFLLGLYVVGTGSWQFW